MKVFPVILLMLVSSLTFSQKNTKEETEFKAVLELNGFMNNQLKDYVSPQFIGGKSGLDEFIAKNIVYPTLAKKHKKEGIVVISYFIDKAGKVSGIRIMSKTPEILNEVIKKAMLKSGPWKPAIKNGKYVKMRMSLSYEFKLGKY